MSGYKVSIEVSDRNLAHRLAAVLGEVFEPAPDAHTLFEHGPAWLVEAFYHGRPPDGAAFGERLGQIIDVDPLDCTFTAVPDLNWVTLSQAALPPVYGGRFTIFGQHDKDRISRGPNAILIDAGEAFGTAHHATTFGCLLAIDHMTRRRRFKSVLDLGTGSGVLAIALRRVLPQSNIIASDVDAQSVATAGANARINGVPWLGPGAIRFTLANGLSHAALRAAAPFDLIVANILAAPLVSLAPEISGALTAAGRLLLSGILVEQAPQLIAVYRAQGFVLLRHDRMEGWSTLVLMKAAR
ncbi:MAG: 50S ribosomal protein L11 methyltransferase [Hyphomicrobiaceae bacterium]